MDEKEAEARPVMGTIFLVLSTIFEGRVTSAPERKEGRARLDKRNERERQSNI